MTDDTPYRDEHGTTTSYRRGCRCAECKRANNEYSAERRARRQAATHGTYTGYTSFGCRCAPCAAAGRAHDREDKEKRWGATPPKHGGTSYERYGCRCTECSAAYAARQSPAQQRLVASWQAESIAAATRHRVEWTGPELEIAARTDLSAREVAEMLGRTYRSVRNMRQKLRTDPRKINAAGIGDK